MKFWGLYDLSLHELTAPQECAQSPLGSTTLKVEYRFFSQVIQLDLEDFQVHLRAQ